MKFSRIASLALLVLPACTALPVGQAEPMTQADAPSHARVGIGADLGVAQMENDGNGASADGGQFGARLEMTSRPGGGLIEFGARTGFSFMALTHDELAPNVDGEIGASQWTIAPLLRLIFGGEEASVQPYVDGAVGYHYTSVTETFSSGSSSVSTDENDDGLWFSLGAGVVIKGGDNSDYMVGLEYQRAEFGELDVSSDAYLVHLGGRWEF